jgi:FkbM family methyltransferase
LLHGTFNEEYPEQLLSVMFISPTDNVLEIGGNIGRNSCVISAMLSDSQNLVVLESDPGIASGLIANRDRNFLSFHVENAAISMVPLIQAGWVTHPNTPQPGHFQVNTLTYNELKEKYQIPFNVLVADCEGALYYIFQDDESILDDVELIIVENDYHHRVHYVDICEKFIAHGFQIAFTKAGGWGPCYNEFYQVWKKLKD